MTSSNALADNSIPPQKALDIVRTLEGTIENATWSVETFEALLQRANDLESGRRIPQGTKGAVLFEPLSGRYTADLQAVLHWSGGRDPYIAQLTAFSFDGECERECMSQKPGQEPPLPGGVIVHGFFCARSSTSSCSESKGFHGLPRFTRKQGRTESSR
jgi:hypothetical protein